MPEISTKRDINVGERLRYLRTSRKLSQRALARKSGVTNGLISQIEQNHSSPSVATLKRVLDAIPLSMAEFFALEFDEAQPIFFSPAELTELGPVALFHDIGAGSGISLRQVGNSAGHAIQMLHERYAPNADTGVEKYSHESEEAGIVISGRIEITVGDETRELGPGCAYRFDSRIPHRFRNPGTEVCELISACTPPSF
ncbi:cupin domain-containing protein [Pseudorhodobacter sp.]|uniref:cupin domain-containing protein n=1 Tax=Pseudorhodobacter sp. TaxID=1934400 RepID=UPI002647E460|nr:cupin domain-containing protein [Pseudorhodobacter sp.]MDN5787355.1 cupin domain-containing protein [Pseudorhodobacter sp.]